MRLYILLDELSRAVTCHYVLKLLTLQLGPKIAGRGKKGCFQQLHSKDNMIWAGERYEGSSESELISGDMSEYMY